MNRGDLLKYFNELVDYLAYAMQQQQAGYYVDPRKIRDVQHLIGVVLNILLDESE